MRRRLAAAGAAIAIAAALAACAPAGPPAGSAPAPATPPSHARESTRAAAPTVGEVVAHGPRGTKLVALTFDLCATPGDREALDEGVVRALRSRGAAATFMMGGLWADAHRAEAVSLAGDPAFEVGDHGMAHLREPSLADAAALAEISRAQDAIERVTGRRPVLYRYPYLAWDRRAGAQLRTFGLTGVSADVVTGDPDPAMTARRLVDLVLKEARGGSIVLMHANGNGIHTAEALPGIIDGLRARGYTLVTVSDLLAAR